MSEGDSSKRKGASATLEFPKVSQSVKPPPWLSPDVTSVRNVNFRDPAANGPQPKLDRAQAETLTKAAAEAERRAAAEAAAREAAESAAREAAAKVAAEERMRQQLLQRSEQLGQAIAEAIGLRKRLLQDTEAQLVELAVKIAAAIVEREIEIDPEVHGRLAHAALSCLGDADKATLRCSNLAYDAVVESLGGHAVEIDHVHVQVIRDTALTGFGCVVETPDTRVDARVQARLDEVLTALRDEIRRDTVEAA